MKKLALLLTLCLVVTMLPGIGYTENEPMGNEIELQIEGLTTDADLSLDLGDFADATQIGDELELDLCDYDIDEVFLDEGEINIFADFKNYGPISKYLEDHDFEIKSFKFERIPLTMRELSPEEQEDVNGLIERLENDDDVVNVFHNMA